MADVGRALLLLGGDVERNPGPKRKFGFEVMSWNMNGWRVRTRTGDLQRLLREKRPAVLMIQETRLMQDPENLVNGVFHGYKFFGKPRTTPVRKDKEVCGGGVAFLVRKDLSCKQIAFNAGSDSVTELQQMEVSLRGKKYKLLNVYRPPCEQTWDASTTDRVTTMAPETWPRDLDVVGGDLNLRHPAWDSECKLPSVVKVATPDCPTGLKRPLADDLLAEMLDRDLLLMADRDKPTYPRTNRVLDLLFASGDYGNRQGHVFTDCFGSDHRPISVEFLDAKGAQLRSKSHRYRWEHANWDVFSRTMEDAAKAALRHDTDLRRTLNLFHKGLKLAIRAAVPMARRLTRKARKKLKQKAYLKAKFNPDSLKDDLLSEAELEEKAEKLAEMAGFCGALPTGEAEAAEVVYARIKEVFGKEDRTPMAALQHPRNDDDSPTTFAETEEEKAELLADLYASVGSESTSEVPVSPAGTAESDAGITVSEVVEALRCQPDGKAAGLDGVECGPLKHLGEHGVLLLRRIFELVYQNGEWPRDWAMACIVPVLKRGKDPSLGGSYRPVSLTSVLAKLCERVIGGRLQHATQHSVSDTQAGFRRGRGTAEHLAACHLRLKSHTQQGLNSAMLCADLSRAFDRVDHNLLLGRLGKLGVRGRLWKVVQAFLRDRKARVRVDGVLSTTRNMTSGVPQGTILAPMLFVLFVDDLAQQMEQAGFHFLAYADDVAFLAAAEEVSQLEEQVARGLDIIEKWAEDLRLMLSREKTVVLARKPDGSKLSLDVKFGADSSGVREELACVPALRYLGLRFEAESDPLCNFVAEATTRAYARMPALRVLAASPWASTQILRTVYLGYVLGTTRYGLALAASASLTELNKMHRRALCVVTGCHVSTPDVMLTTEAAIPSIEDLAREEAAKLREHLLRLPERAPGRLACECGQRATTGWLHEAERLADKLQLCKLPREPLQLTMPFAPWEQPTPLVIHTVEGCNRQMEDEMDVVAKVRRRTNFYSAYDKLPPAVLTVCTDGSVQKNGDPPTTVNGRSGAVWLEDEIVGHSEMEQAGAYASSFSAEYRAMEMGLRKLAWCRQLPVGPIHLLSDSQSALKAVQRGPNGQTCEAGTRVWKHLHRLERRGSGDVTLHFVPAHAGHPGNEAADEMASYPKTEAGKSADSEAQLDVPLPMASAKAAIRAHFRGKRASTLAKMKHGEESCQRRYDVYWKLTAGAAARAQHRTLYRRGERLWHRLRTGFGPLGWAFGSAGYPRPIPDSYKCPECDEKGMSLLHILTSCSHGPTKEAATRIGLRSQCARGQTVRQREKAAKRLIQHHPVVVLRMLCRCGWLDENEHLLIRPGADARSEEVMACEFDESQVRASAEFDEEVLRGSLVGFAARQRRRLEKVAAAADAEARQAAEQIAPPPLSRRRRNLSELARKIDAAEAAELSRREQLTSSVETPEEFAARDQAERTRVAEQCRRAYAKPALPAMRCTPDPQMSTPTSDSWSEDEGEGMDVWDDVWLGTPPNEELLEIEERLEYLRAVEAEEAEEAEEDEDDASEVLGGAVLRGLDGERRSAAKTLSRDWKEGAWEKWATFEVTSPEPVPIPERLSDSDDEEEEEEG